jgi:hypothetical protein
MYKTVDPRRLRLNANAIAHDDAEPRGRCVSDHLRPMLLKLDLPKRG